MGIIGDFFTGLWGLIVLIGLAAVSAWYVVVPIMVIGGLALWVIGLMNRRRRRALAHALHVDGHETGTR